MMKTLCCCSVVLLLFTVSASGADVPWFTKGTTEVGGFVGASYGIDDFRIMGGGNVAYGTNRILMPYAEFTYFPGIGRTFTASSGARYNYSVPLSDFHGGVHIRIPIPKSRVVPYGVFGAGVVHLYSQHTEIQIPADPAHNFPAGVARIDDPSRNDFAVNFGGGIRYYVNERFGVRVEAKAYKPTGQYTDLFGKVTAGFFFQLR